jgi:conserved oligomeric Golgi complex subunit 2
VSTSGTIPRPSTPNINSDSPTVDLSAEDATLRQLAFAISDIRTLDTQMWELWREAISIMLPEPSEDDEDVTSAEGTNLNHIDFTIH